MTRAVTTRRRPLVESLEDRVVLSGGPVISELMASNTDTLMDEDGAYSDWLEIHNPTTAAVDLGGWYLTDSSDDLTKWQFPAVQLDAGEFLVVFASGKDRADPASLLHTDFKLDADSEYLALIESDGVTPAHEYSPAFPQQFPNISYGLSASTMALIADGDELAYRVPTAADAGMATTWTDPTFDDSQWTDTVLVDGVPTAATTAIGFGFDQPVPVDVADPVFHYSFSAATTPPAIADVSSAGNHGTADAGIVLSTDVPTVGVPSTAGDRSLGGSGVGITTNAIDLLENSAIAAAGGFTYEAWFKWNGGGTINSIIDYAGTEKLVLDPGTQQVRMRINSDGSHDSVIGTATPGNWHYAAAVFDTEGNSVIGGSITGTFTLYFDGANVGTTANVTISDFGDSLNRTIGIAKHPLDFGSDYFDGLVFEPRVSLGALVADQLLYVDRVEAAINTDVAEEMLGANASIYVRQEFEVAGEVDTLTLRMKYDDGFVAYLNGTPAAAANAPPTPTWDSAATAAHADAEAVVFETFNLSAHVGLLLETTNVLAIHGLNQTPGDDDLLLATELSAVSTAGNLRYFTTATPGAANGAGFAGLVASPQASWPRGFYTSPILVDLNTPTDGATLRYTLDGSDPTETSGLVYSAPILISGTTTLRAAAFKPDYLPSAIDTNTYIFVDDVTTQSPNGQPPPGWPSGSVNGQVFDYGMDPDIVNSPEYQGQIEAALQAIPTLSLVTDRDRLFDPATGIYVNAQQDGIAWERPTSVELLNPDSSPGFQIDAGLRIRGGFSRGGFNPKHSFRLFFRGDYGATKLEYPLFGDEGIDRFDHIDLRTAQNYAWSNDTFNDASRNSFLRDVFSRDLQRELDQSYTRSRYYHLYLNGQYWGLYQTQERSEASYAEDYVGGHADDYDVIKAGSARLAATDGSLDKWQQLWSICNTGFATDALYYAVQGKNPDGMDNPDLEVHVDVDNLIDYMAVIFFTGNRDAPTTLGGGGPNNFWGIRNRDPATRMGWRFFAYDSEHSMLGTGDNITTTVSAGQQVQAFNPQWLHQKLMQHADYRQRFGDRIETHFFGDGVMTTEKAQALLLARAAEIETAIIAESARWGDQHEPIPYTQADWQAEVDWLVDDFLSVRTDIVLNQLSNAGLYPVIAAPTFSHPPGQVPVGFELDISAPSGTILYTLDGTDPRSIGGGVSPGAQQVSQPIRLTEATVVRTRAKSGNTWSAISQGTFSVGVPAGRSVVISELNYHPAAPPESPLSEGELEFVELYNRSGTPLVLDDWRIDGFGFSVPPDTLLAADGALVVVPFDPRLQSVKAQQFRTSYGMDQTVTLLGPTTGALRNGGETITLLRPDDSPGGETEYIVVDQVSYDDVSPWPEEADGAGDSLTRIADDSPGGLPQSWTAAAPTPGSVEFVLPGDITGDGQVNGLDVDPFVDLLLHSAYDSAADMNYDGSIDGLDVDPFVAVVVGGGNAAAVASLGYRGEELAATMERPGVPLNATSTSPTAERPSMRWLRAGHSRDRDGQAQRIHHRATARVMGRRLRIDGDGHRSSQHEMGGRSVADWRFAVERALADGDDWIR